MSEVICDRRIAGEVKGQTYKMVVRPAVTHDFETKRWKAELKMLGLGETGMNRIINGRVRGTAQLEQFGDRVVESQD